MTDKKPVGLIILSLVVLGIIVFFVNTFANSYIKRVANLMMIYIILAVSLNLLTGFTGIVSLGQIGFMSIGAYTSAILTLSPRLKYRWLIGLPEWLQSVHMHLFPAMLIGGILSVIIALGVGYVILRLRGVYIAVATLGFLVIVKVMAENWIGVTRGGRGISTLPGYTNLWWTTGAALVTIYVVWRLVKSPYGRKMTAIREHDLAAQSVGVHAPKIRLLSFTVSAFFTSIAGSLWANLIGVVSPGSFYLWLTLLIIIMMVVGGMGSITGSVVSVIGFTILLEWLRNFESRVAVYGIHYILFALIFMLIIIFRPQGLFGTREISREQLSEFMRRFLGRGKIRT